MNKIAVSVIISMILCFSAKSQIVITSNDMPVPGDTIRKSFTTFLDGFDYTRHGPDQTWDFTELTVVSQQVDTFMNVGDTPAIYQLFFNNQFIYPDYKATVAQKLASFNSIPGLTLSDSYLFIKNTAQEYREVGYGVSLEGVQVPVQLQEIDTIYRFPLEYGNIDSAHSLLEVDIPDLGFLMISKFRRNTVDGWGTLITPYGEFQTLRVKTEITEYDSIYSDSIGIGFPVIRNITEYKWLANGFHQPLLLVSEEPFLLTATYMDSVRSTFVAVPETRKKKYDFSIYPNPCQNYVAVEYELEADAEVQISLFSLYGNELKRFSSGHRQKGFYNQIIYLKENGFRPGIYLLRLTINDLDFVKKIIVE
jgi:hypothetical protein